MSDYSVFNSFGNLEYSSELPDAEKIYESMRASYVDAKTGISAVDLTPGSYHEAKIYARAMAIADGNASLRRAANQADPLKATESLPHFEKTYRLSPTPSATLEQRRAAAAERTLISRGNRREAIYDALSTILGGALLAIRPVTVGEATVWPSNPELGPGVFPRTDQPARVIRLLDPVVKLSTPVTIAYENADTSAAPLLLAPGNVLCVQPENLALAEKITITGAVGTGDDRTLTATFTKSHDLNATASTGPVPLWLSNAGHILIVVTAAAAINAALVDRVNERMTRLAKAGTTWSIVEPSTPGATTMGPFALGLSPLGAVPLGTVSIPPPNPLTITSLTPSTGSTAGGTAFVIKGTGFTFVSNVQQANFAVGSWSVIDDDTINVVTAAWGFGASTQLINVTASYGATASSPFVFT